MHTVKVGIIGAGGIAQQHLKVIKDCPGIEVVGITSRTLSKANQLAEEYHIPVVATTIDELIDQAHPDALMVLVSVTQMMTVTKLAITCGLPLFIEKPAGLSYEDNQVLADLADEVGILTMVGFNRRWYSVFHQGLDVIRQHGKLLGVRVEGHERFWKLRDAGQTKFGEDVLSNWIYANSVHTIDLLRFFGGDVREIHSIARGYREENGDQFAAVMELESGALGQYSAHWYSPGGWSVVLYGEGVTVEFKPLEQGIWMAKDFVPQALSPAQADVQWKPGFYKQIEAFRDLVKDGKKIWPMQDLSDAAQTMLLAKEISQNVQVLPSVDKGASV